MDAEFTGRGVKVIGDLRRIADEGLTRIEKIVGRGSSAHIIFSSQKRGHAAEVTVKARHHTVVGAAEASALPTALRTALVKAEKQALRRRKTLLEKKHQGTPIAAVLPALSSNTPDGQGLPSIAPQDADGVSANHSAGKTRTGSKGKSAVPKPPRVTKLSGRPIVPAPESMAPQTMTVEEALKEAESSSREVLVFRDPDGNINVLHCPEDGTIRLIEVV